MSNERSEKENRKSEKVYVLDTTVLIDNPHLPYELTDGDVVIPIAVLRELDGLKNSDVISVAQAAREVSRFLNNLGSCGDLGEGVRLSTGLVVRLYPYFEPMDILASDGDNRVLGCAVKISNSENVKVCVVTTDINMLVAARSLGLTAIHLYGVSAEKVKPEPSSDSRDRLTVSLANEKGIVSDTVRHAGSGRFRPSLAGTAVWFFWVGIAIIFVPVFFPSFGSNHKLAISLAAVGCLLLAVGLALLIEFKRGSRCNDWDGLTDSVWFDPSWRHLSGNVWHKRD